MTAALRGVVYLLALATLLPASPADAQSDSEAVTALLDHSEVEAILGSFEEGVRAAVGQLSGSTLSAEASEVLGRHLTIDALLPITRAELEGRGTSETLRAAAGLAEAGAISKVDSIANARPPASTLEEYAASLEAAPPPRERITLVAQIASAQFAGDFYVLLSERIQESAHIIVAAMDPDVPPYAPPTEAAWREQSQQNLLGAVVSFLYRYESVDDDLLEAALTEWSSPAGSWYAEAYTLALGETLLIAADAIAAELGTP
jgi:hypothetical protein